MNQPPPKPAKSASYQPPSLQLGGEAAATKSNAIEIPQITLPKGGGALKGIDEKFEVNAANGTASFSIPLPLSPGRNGFQPSLALSYNSGAGNSSFGLGWDLGFPSIQRKTDKRLPRYRDNEDGDTFMFTGVEDLMPALRVDGGRQTADEFTNGSYSIRRYRPRIEGGFSRIERIWKKGEPTFYWKVVTRDNVASFFGKSESHRIADPNDKSRVFQWLPELSFDDKGNCILFEFKEENLENVPKALHEINRRSGLAFFTNRYLKRVCYGNKRPLYPGYASNPQDWESIYQTTNPSLNDFLFELVFDYGEHGDPIADREGATSVFYNENQTWPARRDAFSSYRSGFEIRTWRLCRRALMFHHFEELGDAPCLVRSLDLEYRDWAKGTRSEEGKKLEVTYLEKIAQRGYVRLPDDTYRYKSLPRLEFTYQELQWHTGVREVEPEQAANAPAGLSGGYQWVDLYGEGLSGVLSEQGDGWYYKSNLGDGQFTPTLPVVPKPSFIGLSEGVLQLQDLEADGRKQIVVSSPGLQGYFELANDAGPGELKNWENFRAFACTVNIDLRDPNVRLLDLDGDGRPEIVLSEEQVFTWYPSAGTQGYEASERAPKFSDEESDPAIVFADSLQTTFLADMSGDGLTDLVRIRNGEVCYWPNLGYGRFGAKVNMSDAPLFDTPDQFNPAYLQLADVSGVGATDLLYLGKNRFRAWLNLGGNSWSEACEIGAFPDTALPNQISVIDFLGNGTSCIVWSSPLPGNSRAPLRYIDLMGGVKPHLMIQQRNGMGKTTTVTYKSSVHFYLKDKKAGAPWITKLPFPVQCVEKVEIEDAAAGLKFTNTYSYHHGYYDHPEREFRGFGRVDQLDTEDYDPDLPPGDPKKLWQAPVLTRTWFHTGMFFHKDKILRSFEAEYWYNDPVFNGKPSGELALPDALIRASKDYEDWRQRQSTTTPQLEDSLTALDYREAARACKGMMLRQETFALDAPYSIQEEKRNKDDDPAFLQFINEARALQKTPYSVAVHNCHIMVLQARGEKNYAVFMPLESEAITYHYERNPTDPRIAHSINLEMDERGNVLKSVAIAYGRKGMAPEMPTSVSGVAVAGGEGDSLAAKLQKTQSREHLAFTENSFTRETQTLVNDYVWRLRAPCEARTFEINTDQKSGGDYYRPADFQDFVENKQIKEYPYEQILPAGGKNRRLVEHVRTLYLSDDLTGPLSLGEQGALGIPYESYQLAWTLSLAQDIFGDRVNEEVLAKKGKYVSSADRKGPGKPFPIAEADGLWWIPSGRPLYYPPVRSKARFFAPFGYEDPLGSQTQVHFYSEDSPDCHWLLLDAAKDAHGNTTRALDFDFRTLTPRRMLDANNNEMEAIRDELGLVVLAAVIGKAEGGNLTGDRLTGANPFLTQAETADFFANPKARAANYIQQATTRLLYDFNQTPTRVATIVREIHFDQVGGANAPLQISIEYSGGLGQLLLKKVQAEKGDAYHAERDGNGSCVPSLLENVSPRWLGSGRTILNNKGNPVKQYEPYFSDTHEYEDEDCVRQLGVTPILRYDSLGRVVRTDYPDGSYTRTEFNPWEQVVYDQNDTLQEAGNQWLKEKQNATPEEKAAAQKTLAHAGTPSRLYLDALSRPFFSIADNGSSQWYATWVDLDLEGNQRRVADARGNIVMSWKYDMLGRQAWQNSMDSGRRWLFNDCTGKPVYQWDDRNHMFHFQYDDLRRPLKSYVKELSAAAISAPPSGAPGRCFDSVSYGDQKNMTSNARQAVQRDNQIGQTIIHRDTAGETAFIRYDVKGNVEQSDRRLLRDYQNPVDWEAAPALFAEVFDSKTRYDALNRPTEITTPHGAKVAPSVIRMSYNEAGLLEKVAAEVQGKPSKTFVENIDYNEKGQRTKIEYGNGVVAIYHYDPKTFRLINLRTIGGSKKFQDLKYVYDAVGNIASILNDAEDAVFFKNKKVDPHSYYEYDALYRLTRAEGREHMGQNLHPVPPDAWNRFHANLPHPGDGHALGVYAESYLYDPVGNILKIQHGNRTDSSLSWTRQFQYAANSNRLLGTEIDHNDPPQRYVDKSALTEKFGYDEHGNMLNMKHLALMEWNPFDQLGHIQISGHPDSEPSLEAWYQYDGGGQRIRKVVHKQGGIIEERIYLGAFELYRKTRGAEQLVRESLHIMDDANRIALVETKTADNFNPGSREPMNIPLVRYQFGNHLGSACLELDDNAKIISYEEYHPYGTTALQLQDKSINPTAKRYRYTGMERDEETGMAYHSARYYAGWMSCWSSPDPIGLADGMNRYTYVQNNPITLLDADGRNSRKTGREGDVGRHGSQGHRGGIDPKTGKYRLQSEHIWPIAHQRESLRNPATGESPIPEGRNTPADRRSTTLMTKGAVSEVKTKGDNAVWRKAVVETKAGGMTPSTAAQLTPEAGLSRLKTASVAMGSPIPLGAEAAVTGQIDELFANPDVQKFSKNPVNNPIVGATDNEIKAAINAPVKTGELTAFEVSGNPRASSVFKGNAEIKMLNTAEEAIEKVNKAGIVDKTKQVLSAVVENKIVQTVVKSKTGKVVAAVAPILLSGVAKAAPGIGIVFGAADVANEAQSGDVRRTTLAAIGMSEIPYVSQVADIGLALEDASWVAKEILDPEQRLETWFYNKFLK